MTRSRLSRGLAAFLVLPVLSLVSGATPATSAGSRPELPRLKVTRHLAPYGTESIALTCYPETEGGNGFYCDIVRDKGGTVAATVGIRGADVDDLLRKFFRAVPKEVPQLGGDPVLTWDIRYGPHESRGTVPRHERAKSGDAKAAVLQLEASLSAQFYR